MLCYYKVCSETVGVLLTRKQYNLTSVKCLDSEVGVRQMCLNYTFTLQIGKYTFIPLPDATDALGRRKKALASGKTSFMSNKIDHTAPHIRHTFKVCSFLAAVVLLCVVEMEMKIASCVCFWLWFHHDHMAFCQSRFEDWAGKQQSAGYYWAMKKQPNVCMHIYIYHVWKDSQDQRLKKMVSFGLSCLVTQSQSNWIGHYFYRAMINGP